MAVNLERAPATSPYSHIYVPGAPGAGNNAWQRTAHRARQAGGTAIGGGTSTVLNSMQPSPGFPLKPASCGPAGGTGAAPTASPYLPGTASAPSAASEVSAASGGAGAGAAAAAVVQEAAVQQAVAQVVQVQVELAAVRAQAAAQQQLQQATAAAREACLRSTIAELEQSLAAEREVEYCATIHDPTLLLPHHCPHAT